MFDRIRALLARLHQVEEVQSLTDRDLDDLGMTRDQVLDFLRMPTDITQRVTAMGAIFGVPEAELRRDHAQWVELLSTCGHCESRGACSKVLALADMADPARVDFCGNARAFNDLAPHAASHPPLRRPPRAALMRRMPDVLPYTCQTESRRKADRKNRRKSAD